jgi:hypothetical protein
MALKDELSGLFAREAREAIVRLVEASRSSMRRCARALRASVAVNQPESAPPHRAAPRIRRGHHADTFTLRSRIRGERPFARL